MKTVDIATDDVSLREYACRTRNKPLLVTRGRRPLAVVVPLAPGTDQEALALSLNPRFRALILRCKEQAHKEGGMPLDEVCRTLGIQEAARQPAHLRQGKRAAKSRKSKS